MTAVLPAAPRGSAMVFDDVAEEYDRRRPGYPEEVLARACELARVGSGERVLELGCGSGQLTRALLARGLHVVALEPGRRLLALAARNLRSSEELELVHARFEDAQLPRASFRALFSASAFHWIDPRVSWQKAAEVLTPGGTLALLQYFGLSDPRSDADQDALLAALARIAPDTAASWPRYRDLPATLAGANQRRENISEVWGWLGGYDLAEPRAAELFGEVQIAAFPVLLEHSADELNALAGTLSPYARLKPSQRRALERETVRLRERLGRPIRSSTVAVVVTARRSPLAGPAARPVMR